MILETPDIEDPDVRRQIETIQIVMVPILVISVVFAGVAYLFLPSGTQSMAMALVAGGLLAGCLLLARSGRPRAGGAGMVAILWLIATLSRADGGLSAPGQGVFLIAVLAAAFCVSLRAALVTTAFSIASIVSVSVLEMQGSLPATGVIPRDAATYMSAQVTILVAASGLVWVVLRRIKEAVAEAGRSEALHRLVADSADEFIWRMDADGSFLYASPAVERILGFTPEEMLERRAEQSQLAAGSVEVADLVAETITSGRQVLQYEAEQVRKDGEYVWCEFTARLMVNEKGELEGLTGVTRDISARKEAERRREELERQLNQSQKMEAIGQLAGGIAHDFNNYLMVILGNVELMLAGEGGKHEASLHEVQDAATRSADLTRQLLAFSRKQVMEPVVLDLNRAIRETDRLLRRVLGEDVSIETICAAGLGRVEVDPAQLEQVILNLAVNARAAMPDGGHLTIETANVDLGVSQDWQAVDIEPGPYVMLAVTDTGVGMDADVRERVFEPFFTTRESGSGLGLSTVHGIVTQSGGAVHVYSEPGRGTTFRIYLPRVEEKPVESSLDGSVVGESGLELPAITVLVVEDQGPVRRFIERVLESRGCRLLLAGDAESALDLMAAEQDRIDLLLTDVVLPGRSGTELGRALQDRMPVVYMSGFTEQGLLRSDGSSLARYFLQKPFTSHQLLRKIHEALETGSVGESVDEAVDGSAAG